MESQMNMFEQFNAGTEISSQQLLQEYAVSDRRCYLIGLITWPLFGETGESNTRILRNWQRWDRRVLPMYRHLPL